MGKGSSNTSDCKQYKPVGSCIYCGSTKNLETEHIIPFGLSGAAILPESTCRKCARITGSFEQNVLRGPFLPIRVFRDLKSRTKYRDAPKTLPITIVRNGQEEILELRIDEYPIHFHFPVFPPPALLTKAKFSSGISVMGVYSVLFGPRPDEVGKSLGATQIKLVTNYEPVEFSRMIAKIGYAYACAERATI